jgi:hypothetical protein
MGGRDTAGAAKLPPPASAPVSGNGGQVGGADGCGQAGGDGGQAVGIDVPAAPTEGADDRAVAALAPG